MNFEAKWNAMISASEQINRYVNTIHSMSNQVTKIRNDLYLTGSPSVLQKIKSELGKCAASIDNCSSKTVSLKNVLVDSANMYRKNERELMGLVFSKDFLGVDTEIGLLSGSAVAYLAKLSGSYEKGLFKTEGNIYAGKAYASWDNKLNLFDYKSEKKEYSDGTGSKEDALFIGVKSEGKAGVSVVSADVKADLGTDDYGIGVEAEGDLLTAYAEAGVKIGGTNKDGKWEFDAVAKGSAIVAAAKGEVKGTVNFLGFKITPKIGGYAGAAGVEGKAGFESGEGFVLEGGVAAGLGVSGGVSVGWDADDFFNSVEGIGDYLKFW